MTSCMLVLVGIVKWKHIMDLRYSHAISGNSQSTNGLLWRSSTNMDEKNSAYLRWDKARPLFCNLEMQYHYLIPSARFLIYVARGLSNSRSCLPDAATLFILSKKCFPEVAEKIEINNSGCNPLPNPDKYYLKRFVTTWTKIATSAAKNLLVCF